MNQEELSAMAHQIFDAQPFSRFIGAELTACGADHATITIHIKDELTQQHGFVHGGVLSYLADNAITFAGGLALGGNALTSEFKINYLKPAQGARLVARATARHVGKRQAVCQCELFCITGEQETLCALAQGTVVVAS